MGFKEESEGRNLLKVNKNGEGIRWTETSLPKKGLESIEHKDKKRKYGGEVKQHLW